MKTFAILALAVAAFANPITEPDALAEAEPFSQNPAMTELEKRSAACRTTGSDVRYRTGPHLNCGAPGQYSGTNVAITVNCYDTGDTAEGTNKWYRASNGYWSISSLIRCGAGSIPKCPAHSRC